MVEFSRLALVVVMLAFLYVMVRLAVEAFHQSQLKGDLEPIGK